MGATGQPDRVGAVRDELSRLAKRLIDRTFVDVDKEGPLDLPILFELAAERFPDWWGEKPTEALEALVLQGALKLDGRFGGSGRISSREAALWMFNLDGGEIFKHIDKRDVDSLGKGEDASGKAYDEIHDNLVSRAGWKGPNAPSAAKVGRAFTGLRRGLAEALLGLDSVAVVETPDAGDGEVDQRSADVVLAGGLDTRPLLADSFVSRPEYEARIRRIRETSTRLMWLHGDAGTGKTRLARAANRDIIPEHLVPVLHAGDQQRLNQDLAVLIADSGIDAGTINTTNVWARLNELLSRNNAPPVIVFDDVPVGTDILGRIGATGRSLLIFTSLHAPPQDLSGRTIAPLHELQVRELEAAESIQMLRSRLPRASDAERAQLAHAVGGRPLAIEHSAAFIRSTGLAVADYCAALAQEPAEILETAGDGHGRTLTQVYRLTLQRLGESPDALRALDLIVFGATAIPPEALLEAWVERLELPAALPEGATPDDAYVLSSSLWCGAWPGVTTIAPTRLPRFDAASKARLHGALKQLERFGLVRSDSGLLAMHHLTASILRSLRADHAGEVYERFLAAAHVMLQAENWQGGDALMLGRLWWAPRLREALGRAVAHPEQLATAPTDRLIRLATVAGAVLRADRQTGTDPSRSVGIATAPALAALMRRDAKYAPVPDEEALLAACRDVCVEAVEYLVLARQFDHSVDSFPNPGAEPTPFQVHLANSIRLKYATEWELAHHYVNVAARKQQAAAARRALGAETASVKELRASAQASVATGVIHYDAAQWDAAVDAFEHAYGCYLQVGANVECVRGAMDAARRLARVHLRAGHVDEARAWLDRLVIEVYRRRAQASMDGAPSFMVRDRLLEYQIVQASNELDLTRAVSEWDGLTGGFGSDSLSSFAEPRLPLARRAVELAQTMKAGRLLPELTMYLRRLEALSGSPSWTHRIDQWFDPEKDPYRHTLLRLQAAVFATPSAALALATSDDEFRRLQEPLPPEQREYLSQIRTARTKAAYDIVRLAQEIGVTHANPFWHTRGLCAAVMLATASDSPSDRTWTASVRDAAKQGADTIGRPDWVEKVDGFLDDNGGLWLLGY